MTAALCAIKNRQYDALRWFTSIPEFDPNALIYDRFGYRRTNYLSVILWTTRDLVSIEILLDAGANPDPETIEEAIKSFCGKEFFQKLFWGAENRSQYLYTAIKSKNIDALDVLLSTGADVNYVNVKYDGTPLMRAAFKGNIEQIKLLVAAGADVNMQYKNTSALRVALDEGQYQAADTLIELGAEISKICNPNPTKKIMAFSTPLMTALEKDNFEYTKKLIEAGQFINERSLSGLTPLNYAIKNGKVKTVKLLLEHGADINQIDYNGKTAFDYSRNCKDFEAKAEIVGLLCSAQRKMGH